ncbi:sugar kinase [Aureimonas endophytica]|uniref:Sugar kinase n=1 Tax=Aureimonas endophytica TaxID=2027858 RepID=A0A916ZS38_9HYPH|nr:ROK family transcriptional regulator [Aureimonas endophytica]GGE11422.1 sugar kinase [Aureimonas endophytica]
MTVKVEGARAATGREPGAAAGGGELLALIASGEARSRSALADRAGLSRATVAQRLSALLEAGLVEEAEETLPSGGRPARVLRLRAGFAVILAADLGERRIRLAATDLDGRILEETSEAMDLRRGPEPVLDWMARGFRALLARLGRAAGEVLGIGLSLPAPVDFARGRVVGPSVMPGWDEFDIRSWLEARLGAPVFAENDVNLLALADHRRLRPLARDVVYVKIGTGIGSAIITDGRIYRGAQGGAGDIGHIQFLREPAPLCRCGKVGCVEARAAGWAIARELRAEGIEAREARDVVALIRLGEPLAIHLVREAGRILGDVLASVVSILNPSTIVIGGTLADAEDTLLAGIREVIYHRSLPLATRELAIVTARPSGDAGITGAALLVRETRLAPGAVEDVIARHGAARRSAR